MFGLIIGAVLSLASGVFSFAQSRSAAKAQEQAAEYAATLAGRRAEAMEIRAKQERAISERKANEQRAESQREAADQRKQGRLVASRATALAAASGAGVDDPTITGILADIDTEAELRALGASRRGEEAARLTQWQGGEQERALNYGAVLERAGGEGERYAGQVEASLTRQRGLSSLVQGVGGAVSKGYGAYSEYQDSVKTPGSGSEPIALRPTSTLYAKYAAPYQGWENYY